MSRPFVLMHISDPHFHRLPRNPLQYGSKRLLGAANLVLRRRRKFPAARARSLVAWLAGEVWDHLVITGDLTQLGTDGEFRRARAELAPLLARGPAQVTILPGNHDRYVPERPGAGGFEAHFAEYLPQGALLTQRLTEHWWLVGWDSARAAPWLSAAGLVPQATLDATDAWLAGLPAAARVIVANHYPAFFPPPHRYQRSHDLLNQDAVAAWLLDRPVHLYLHGHIHHNWVLTVERPRHGALTVVNSAASTQVPRPADPSALHRIVLDGTAHRVEPLRYP